MTIVHQILVDRVGGTTVISCRALDFYNLELQGDSKGKIKEEDVKKTIYRQLHIPAEDPRRDFEVEIEDNRPEDRNYNEQRKEADAARKPKE